MTLPVTVPFVSFGDYHSAAALGYLIDVTHIHKFGRNEDIDTPDVNVDIIPESGQYLGQPESTTPEIVEILHPNAADNSTSTGMRSLQLVGLKTATSQFYETETITLTPGGTTTDSVSSWYRIISVRGKTFGSGGRNEGTITARHKVTTANVFAIITEFVGRSQIAVFTAPFNTKVAIKDLQLDLVRVSGADGSATVAPIVREFGSGGYTIIDNINIASGGGSYKSYYNTPLILNPLDDLIIRTQTVSDGNSSMSAQFDAFMLNQGGVFGVDE